MPAKYTAVDGWRVLALLKTAGWEARNSSSHVVLSKPGERQIVIRPNAISHDALVAAEKALGYKIQGYRRPGRTTAEQVADDLIALGGGGERFERNRPEMPELTVRNANSLAPQEEEELQPVVQAPTPVAPEVVVKLPNESDQLALIRLVRRQLERLDIEFQQLEGRYQQIKMQKAAAITYLESMGIQVDELKPTPGQAVSYLTTGQPTKRTVLPASKPPTFKKPRVTDAEKDKIRMAWIDTGGKHDWGWAKKLQDKLKEMGMDVPDHVLYTGAKSWLK